VTTPSARAVPDRVGTPRWLVALAALVIVAHLAVVAWGPYGPHRDALLYYAMGEHLRLFAMDFPPFIALVARAFTVFGNIELLTHVPVAGAHAALVVFAAAFAQRAGGGGSAQAIAAVAIATAPVFMRAGSLFQPVVFDQLWWTAALWLLAGIGSGTHAASDAIADATNDSDDVAYFRARRRWLLLGTVLGLGLLTKFTVFVLGAGILVALLVTPLRAWLRTRWPWLAAIVALVVGSPSLIGQVVLGWPFLGQFRDLATAQLAHVSPVSFIAEQALMVGPVVVLAAAVAIAVAWRGGDSGLRAVVCAAAAAFVLMLLASGKPYYIAPIWPALLGIAIGRTDAWLGRRALRDDVARRRRTRLERVATLGTLWVIVAGWGAITLPLGLPFLPPEPMSRYAAWLGAGTVTNVGERIALPQDFADMLGWEELAAATQAVWDALPAEDRARAVIMATNYGRAGAIDWFAGDALPPVIAPVGSYWFRGPGELPGAVVIVVGAEAAELEGTWFGSAVEALRVLRPWGVPEEQDVPIVVARDPPLRCRRSGSGSAAATEHAAVRGWLRLIASVPSLAGITHTAARSNWVILRIVRLPLLPQFAIRFDVPHEPCRRPGCDGSPIAPGGGCHVRHPRGPELQAGPGPSDGREVPRPVESGRGEGTRTAASAHRRRQRAVLDGGGGGEGRACRRFLLAGTGAHGRRLAARGHGRLSRPRGERPP
jgi:4-amino-4-deoxy-L-arabinose transferase-like glycosyltransferase